MSTYQIKEGNQIDDDNILNNPHFLKLPNDYQMAKFKTGVYNSNEVVYNFNYSLPLDSCYNSFDVHYDNSTKELLDIYYVI